MSDTEERYPEILLDVRDKWRSLLEENGLDEGDARRLAFLATEMLRQDWGGQNIYVPKGLFYELSKRDLEIYRKFNGTNRQQLCREHGISEQRLYQIVNAVHEDETRRRQIDMFNKS